MKNIILIIAIIVFSTNLYAQFQLIVETNPSPQIGNGDTLTVCKDADIQFVAKLIDIETEEPISAENFHFEWVFGDGTELIGIGHDTVYHAYSERSGFYVRIKVWDNQYVQQKTIPVCVATKPNFAETKPVEDLEAFCKGAPVELKAGIEPSRWIYEPKKADVFFKPLAVSNEYTLIKEIVLESFSTTALLQSGDLEYVAATIEHSNSGAVEIKLSCPDGTSVVLHQRYDDDIDFGEPILDDAVFNDSPGIMYTYKWMSQEEGLNYMSEIELDSVPQGNYRPNNPLETLVGCPLNGRWILEISDNSADDNGYVAGWELGFRDNFFEPLWSFTNTYDWASITWEGDSILPTIAQDPGNVWVLPQAFAPDLYGISSFKMSVRDNFGCIQDTTIKVEVSSPGYKIVYAPSSQELPCTVTFTDTTAWSYSYTWDFGDGSQTPENLEEVSNFYINKGEYRVLLTVENEAGNCSDTISYIVDIKPPTIEIKNTNAFTPNGDGANDVFRILAESTETAPDGKLLDAYKFQDFEGAIYSRWGTKVCEWKNAEEALKGWDGTIGNDNGAEAADGVYYWVIKARGKNDVNYKESGFVYLVR